MQPLQTGWLLSLSTMHPKPLPDFPWLEGSSLLLPPDILTIHFFVFCWAVDCYLPSYASLSAFSGSPPSAHPSALSSFLL